MLLIAIWMSVQERSEQVGTGREDTTVTSLAERSSITRAAFGVLFIGCWLS